MLVPHLPHELQMAVPLTSLWHALQLVAESGLHPLKAEAACGTSMSKAFRSTPHVWPLLGVVLEVGSADEDVEELLVGRSLVLEVGETVIVDWLEEGLLEGRVLEVEGRSDDVLEAVDDRLGTVDELLGTVEDRLGTVDEDRELASLAEDDAGVVLLADESDGEDAALEAWDELDTTELVGPDELAAPAEELREFELELAADGVADELSEEVMLDMTEDKIELMLDRSALLVMVVTGTNDELSLLTDVMTDDEAGVVASGVVLVVVGLLEVVVVVVLTTNPLLTDVTVTPLTVTVVGTVTLATDTVTGVLPWTVVVTVGAV